MRILISLILLPIRILAWILVAGLFVVGLVFALAIGSPRASRSRGSRGCGRLD